MSTVTDPSMSAPSGSFGVPSIDRVLDGLQGEDLSSVPGARLDGEVVDLHRAATRLEAEQLRRLGEWERQGVWALDGSKSPAAALARRCGIAIGTARDRLRIAARLRQAPMVAAAFAAGRLSLGKVRLLVALVDRTDTLRSAFTDAEAELVRHAQRLSLRDTAYLVNHFAAAADPDGHEADWQHLYDNNRFHVAESLDGCGHLDGFLDPESTQIARHALGVIEDRLYRTEHTNRDQDNDTPTLTPAQRRAEAFVALCQSVLDDDPARDDNLAGVARPVITAILDTTTVLTGAAGGQPSTPDHHPDPDCGDGCDDEHAEPAGVLAANTIPLPRPVAQRLVCDAVFVRVLTKAGRAPLDISRGNRHPTTAILRALLLRDGGCAFPGCETPPRFCHAHHLHHWEHGGTTGLFNLVLVCRHHHQLLHQRRWRCHIGTDGLPRFTTPDGTQLPAHPTPLHHARTGRQIATRHRASAST